MGMVNETLKAPACSPAIEAFSIAARRSAAVVHQRHHVNAPVPVVGVRDVVGTERDRANLNAVERDSIARRVAVQLPITEAAPACSAAIC